MSAFHSSLTLLCLLTVQGAEKNQPHVDDQGMPLPKGAIARLGTLRLVHPGEVRSLAFSPDGTVIASGVSQGKKVYLGEKTIHQGGALTVGSGVWVTHASIRLWNVANGKLLREMKTPDAPVTALLFDSTGKTLFAGCGKFLCAWNLKTGKKIWQQEGAKGGVYHYGVRVERLLLAKDRLFSIHEGEVYCPVNRNGGFALFHHPQYAVRCWNRRTGKPVSLPESFRSTVKTEGRIPVLFHEIALTPDAHFAAVIVSDAKPGPTFEAKWTYKNRRLQIIETSTGKGIHSIPDQSGAMSHLTFSADGKTLALIHNQELRLLDRVSGNKRILDKKVSDVDRLLIQDDTLTAQRDDRSIQAWDLKSGKRLRSHRFSERDFESARHGKKVGVMFFNTIRLVDLRSGKDLHGFDGHRLTPLIRYSHSEKNILLSRDPETVMRWQTDTGKCSEALSIPGQHSKYWWRYTRNGDMEKEASTEKRWYVKRVKKKLEIRHIKTNRLVRVIDKHCDEYDPCYFSEHGTRLMIDGDGDYFFFDVQTGKLLSKVRGRRSSFLGYNCPPKLSPSGKWFATNRDHSSIDLFNATTGKKVRSLVPSFHNQKGRSGSVLGFRFSSDEKVILGEVHELISHRNGFSEEKVSVTLWDVSTGKILREFVIVPQVSVFFRRTLNQPSIKRLALSNDHRHVAWIAPKSKTIEIWEVATGKRRDVISGHLDVVADLAFAPDDRQLASSSESTNILIWDLKRLPKAK